MTNQLSDPAAHDRTLSDVELAHRLADAAGDAILPHFRQPELSAVNKLAAPGASGFDPVTAADRAAETAMREMLARHRPDDGIWGEEFGRIPGTSGREWVLDPIDGTRAFLSGATTWGVLIALGASSGRPELGIIDQPYTGERFIATDGVAQLQAPREERRLVTRSTAALDRAILFSTFPGIGTADERAAFDRVSARVMLTRFGMDCYAYALLAAGHIDLVIEAGLNAYDIQAPIALIEAAGGIVTDWAGAPAWGGGQVLAAANPRLHAAALDLLRAGD
ncbi:inositol monophosphatase family protein [Pontibaca methylaminivorans]|uniref:Histidinol-phosphatase, inositol monophosphatase family n=1 Tax=Pontibaca methylaminivorans TaxID=515897 RepID=A0A1R3WME8_9RHOB|nr:inositol monophosphatase family protein [Pontibaca methylaminivorans]SIT79381.1 histidinol-phosphatase, inositol monophosphatase family [Pontibaca methylaminivorans]